MSISAIAEAIPRSVRIPGSIRDSLRARIVTGVGIMLLPLFGLVMGALLGVSSVEARFREVIEEVTEEMEPVSHLQIEILRAVIPANNYLIHGEMEPSDQFARLKEKVDRAFARLREPGPFHAAGERELIGQAHEDWQEARLIGERLLAIRRPVGDAAAASEMRRMDARANRAVAKLAQLHEIAHAEIEREFAQANATGRAALWAVLGIFGLGFAVALSVGAALAWSIMARVRALSDGARAFSEGNLSYRIQLEGRDELGRLAGVFNAMAAELDRNQLALKEMAIRDALTGLHNRREFDRRFGEELERCKRYRHSLSLLLIDVDHFKAINDGCGHPAGDRVLRELAEVIRNAARGVDEIARYGGEEFMVLSAETDKHGAGALAQRIREAVAAHPFSVGKHRPLTVTVSIGLAVFPHDADSGETLITAADRALYHAKRAGRNCVRPFAADAEADPSR